MAKDCLVTKLKGVVQNDNLPVLGQMTIENLSETEQIIRLVVSEPVEIISKSGGNTLRLLDSGSWTSSIIVPANNTYKVYIKKDTVIIKNKYAITKINNHNDFYTTMVDGKYLKFNIDDLAYCDLLTFEMNANNLFGHLKSFAGKTFDNLQLTVNIEPSQIEGTLEDVMNINFNDNACLQLSQSITGSIEVLSGNFRNIYVGTSCNGDINKMFSQCPNLEEFRSMKSLITGTINTIQAPLYFINVGGTKVNGEILKFCATQVSVGRTTGELSTNWYGFNITFDGVVPGTGGETVKWRPTTSDISNGVTDVMSTLLNKAVVIDANGNKVGDTTPW